MRARRAYTYGEQIKHTNIPFAFQAVVLLHIGTLLMYSVYIELVRLHVPNHSLKFFGYSHKQITFELIIDGILDLYPLQKKYY